jgi:hypothetical protein
MAPEILNFAGIRTCGFAADMYSMGVVAIVLQMMEMPDRKCDRAKIFRRKETGNLRGNRRWNAHRLTADATNCSQVEVDKLVLAITMLGLKKVGQRLANDKPHVF